MTVILGPTPYRAACEPHERDSLAKLMSGSAFVEAVRSCIQHDNADGLMDFVRVGRFRNPALLQTDPKTWWTASCKPEFGLYAPPLVDALATVMSQVRPPDKGKTSFPVLALSGQTIRCVRDALLEICEILRPSSWRPKPPANSSLLWGTGELVANVACAIDSPELVEAALSVCPWAMQPDESDLDPELHEPVVLPIHRAIYFGSMKVLEAYKEQARWWVGLVERDDGLDHAHFLDFSGLIEGFTPNPKVLDFYLRDQCTIAQRGDLFPPAHVAQLRKFIVERVIGGNLECVHLLPSIIQAVPEFFEHPQLALRIEAEIASVRRGIRPLLEHLLSTGPLSLVDARDWNEHDERLAFEHPNADHYDEMLEDWPHLRCYRAPKCLARSHPFMLLAEGVHMRVLDDEVDPAQFALLVLKQVIAYWDSRGQSAGLLEDLTGGLLHHNLTTFTAMCFNQGWMECIALIVDRAPEALESKDHKGHPPIVHAKLDCRQELEQIVAARAC